MTESFKQWVIEDHFVQATSQVGTSRCADDERRAPACEKMKLRLLNASHQALCYIGMLLGYQLVHETMEDADIRTPVQKMMDDDVTPIFHRFPALT